MDKSAIRNFAVTARKRLKEQLKDKAAVYGITEKGIKEIELFADGFRVGGKVYDKTILKQYRKLVKAVEYKGFENVIEEVAYTWFNRFVALRFMEVNGYMPFNIYTKVLAGEDGKNEPEIIAASKDMELVSPEAYYSCLDKGDIEGLYKSILINLCNKLSTVMPNMFEKISDYTELLLPDHLYTEGGIINLLVNGIDEDDFRNQVEIIGWLYQFYISEKKAQVDEAVAKGRKVSKDDLPAKTQLFTPDWIVKYLIENSLGRLWLEKGDENSRIKGNWKYYLGGELIKDGSKLSPEAIKIIDPACGSGHMLVYAFDVLYEIYVSCGYAERDIPQLILEKNLYGIDIDERAAQLAYFALIMKARSKNRRLFRQDYIPEVHIYSIQESNSINRSQLDKLGKNFKDMEEWKKTKEELLLILDLYKDAREYGSIIKIDIDREIDFKNLFLFIDNADYDGQISLEDTDLDETVQNLRKIVEIAAVMADKYDIVVTNPPYLGKGMSPLLSDYVKRNYPDSKSDLFAVFIERGFWWLKPYGYNAMVTMQSWMFLSSFEKMRKKLLSTKHIVTMCHMDDNVMGIAFGTSATVFKGFGDKDYMAQYCYVTMQDTKEDTPLAFPPQNERYRKCKINNFIKMPGSPIAYWVSDNFIKIFSNKLFYDYTISDGQNVTGDNNRFVRFFWEISNKNIGKGNKWIFYAKGGGFRKWYGNLIDVVDWSDSARQHYKSDPICRIIPEYLWYKKGITWGLVTSNLPSFRILPDYSTFDKGGSSVFFNDYNNFYYFLGLLNSKVFLKIVQIYNPTLNFQVKDIRSMPIIIDNSQSINMLVKKTCDLSKSDWDDFETSWDFKVHPLVKYKADRIEGAFKTWAAVADERFKKLKANEEELNRIFIEIYGLQDELTPEVADEDITVRRAELDRDIRSFISYAVGCMFGRYSLDHEGLIYAGGTFDKGAYKTFIPDEDNIIPVTEQDYFENDIVSRFIEFVEKVYGEEFLEENLAFIAKALKPASTKTARQIIREYFFHDFFKDHCRIYKKRPIYWQFETGPAGAMKALVYLHRMDEFTPARVRTDYLHPLMRAYEGEIKRIDQLMESTLTAAEKAAYHKQKEDLQKKTAEIMKYDPVIAHIANRRIKLDLDDGVAVNYQKFQNIEVVEDGKPSVTSNLLTRI